ncbi:BTB/POZ domain-containing protein [Aspergillus ibericus CBS 121593]|uniref:BTB domain-containing protein n=1 Tax=Aspergillus ibericus CBS 121593 TaxID=1448316 RepID=A0A395HAN7_9EURO|nr:hypothetical protein BO80DRAFT_451869 [Aspergillus ibericus CBS 121593]RAL04902.1 hypothetical protein BO80DRAFT_451869 [Aspergillus ibericus CBS 121593]
MNPFIEVSSDAQDSTYSDLTVLCESSVFKVYSCIVCPQSSFFEKAISGNFQEAISREITLEDDPLILTKIFDYLYCATYDDSQDTPEQTESAKPSETPTIDNKGSRARINTEIYALADKYQIEGLIKLSKQKLQSHLESNWEYLEFIDTHLSALQHQQLFHDILRTFATFSYDFSALMIEKVLQLEQKL